MGTRSAPLSELRDIHLPVEPGWWILLALGLGSAFFTVKYLVHRSRLRKPQRRFCSELNSILATELTPSELTGQVSGLVKRLMITLHGREKVAHLQGQAWLEFLDTTTPDGQGFSHGPGVALASAQYRPDSEVDIRALAEFLDRWARQQT